MKKVISLLLSLIILACIYVPVSANDTVYTGSELENENRLFANNAEVSFGETAEGVSYARISAKAGTYENGALRLHFCPLEISLGDFPYVKVIYRTDAMVGVLDSTNRTTRGEGWLTSGKHPEMENDEKWHSVVINMNEMTGGKGPGLPGEMNVQLVLKPFGTQKAFLTDDAYFDIHSIACFRTQQEAEAFTAGIEETKEIKTFEKSVYGINRLENEYVLSVTEAGLALALENDLYHITSKSGSYTNDQLKVTFEFSDISLTEHTYLKLCYRTDSPSQKIDTTIRSSKNESWLKEHPVPQSDGKWHELIININDMTGGGGLPPEGEMGIKLVLKPFGSGNVTLSKDVYFDIKYIAAFANEDEAKAYVYDPADDIVKTTKGITLETADKALVDKYMSEIDARIEEIINTETEVEIKGTKYYVSSDGNDANDGKSPESAWKSLEKLNEQKFENGDGVFLRRGDVFVITSPIMAQNGVTYSAYGYGHKPIIDCSADASGKDKWVLTDKENVYRFTGNVGDYNSDIGSIVFNMGEAFGVKVSETKSGNRHNSGIAFNGIEWLKADTHKFDSYNSLFQNLEFYHDWESGSLYLCSLNGNPGEIFDTIDLCDKGHGFGAGDGGVTDVVIDNLEIYGTGSHAIGFGGAVNTTVQNSVFRMIGGSVQNPFVFGRDYHTRFGNAVESYGNCLNFVIKNNYASQVYDCCFTAQNSGAYTFDKIEFYGNVAEYANNGLEVWMAESGRVSNMLLHDNYTRYTGYGFSNQRPLKDGNFFYGGTDVPKMMKNNGVYNNVNLFASAYSHLVIATGKEQFNFHDNVYIMEEGKNLGGIAATPENGSGKYITTKYDEFSIKRATARGFEQGSKFYVADAPYEEMFDSYVPYVRVKLYSDVKDGFWGKDAVDFVSSRGYFEGVTHTEFAPDLTMTRAMLVTVLSRIAGESSMGKSTYSDVNDAAWYAQYVAWAEKSGIVSAGGKFRPDDYATREEIADMLAKFAAYNGLDTSAQGKNFTDSSSINASYVDSVNYVSSLGIISGYPDGSLKPQNSVTRAEAATMIQRFVNLIDSGDENVL